jgi:hypothetical protein
MPEPQEGQQNQSPNPAANLPLNPDLMGYPTVDALVNAKRASDQEARRIHDENESLKTQLQYAYQPQANPRQEVKQRSTPSDRLAEIGVPVDALSQYVGEELQKAFAPIAAGLNARNTVLAQYPDYNKFESDVAQFIQSDPGLNQTYQRMFSADPAGAFEYAFLKFGESRRRSANATDTTGLMQEAGVHAGIPMSRNGETRRTDTGDSANMQKLFEEYQRTGSKRAAEAYAHARLHGIVSDDHLNV